MCVSFWLRMLHGFSIITCIANNPLTFMLKQRLTSDDFRIASNYKRHSLNTYLPALFVECFSNLCYRNVDRAMENIMHSICQEHEKCFNKILHLTLSLHNLPVFFFWHTSGHFNFNKQNIICCMLNSIIMVQSDVKEKKGL